MRTTNVPTATLDLVRRPERVSDGSALDEIARLVQPDPEKMSAYLNIPSAIRTPNRGIITVRTHYGPDFSTLIRISGIRNETLRELLHMEKAPLTDAEKDLLQSCESLSPKAMKQYLLLAKEALDPIWLDTTEIPSPRAVLQYYAQTLNRMDKMEFKKKAQQDPEASGVARCMESYFVRIPLDNICYAAKMLCGISPHFFLRLDPDIHLYADRDDIEEFFDYYTLLPSLWKRILLRSICEGGDQS